MPPKEYGVLGKIKINDPSGYIGTIAYPRHVTLDGSIWNKHHCSWITCSKICDLFKNMLNWTKYSGYLYNWFNNRMAIQLTQVMPDQLFHQNEYTLIWFKCHLMTLSGKWLDIRYVYIQNKSPIPGRDALRGISYKKSDTQSKFTVHYISDTCNLVGKITPHGMV